jgi:hypothetical protein
MPTRSPHGMNSVSCHPASPHTTTLNLSPVVLHMECLMGLVGVEVKTGRGEVDRKMSKAVPWHDLANHRTLHQIDNYTHTVASTSKNDNMNQGS